MAVLEPSLRPEKQQFRLPDVTPGGILDGLRLSEPVSGPDMVIDQTSTTLPWTVSQGGARDVAVPDYEDFIRARPPGVSVDKNILRALTPLGLPWWMPSKPTKYAIMENLFQTGHEMDYKKTDLRYRDFGNFNYGAFGSALGLSPYELHSGAGYQQFRDKHWEPSYGIPGLMPPFGDNKQDYEQIDAGIRYYQAHHPHK